MPGIRMPLGVAFTDATLPKSLVTDPMESPGSLVLIEPEHPTSQWAPGVPANAGTVPNVLANLGAAAVGAAVPTCPVVNTYPASNIMILERSAKGGIHGAISPTNGTASSIGLSVGLPNNVITYLQANPAHNYYMSVWARLTKVPTTSFSYPSQGSLSGFEWSVGGVTPAPNSYTTSITLNTTRDNIGVSSSVDTGPVLRNISVSGFSPTFVAGSLAALATRCSGFTLGNYGVNASNGKGLWGGYCLYRYYLEDLTVSGRTFAQMDALDSAQLANAIGAASSAWGSGRYNGDTLPTADSSLT